ncbi:MAG: cyclase family protein [Xanthobacteraceae bacterium]
MSRIVDLTLPVTSDMAGIPKIAFYQEYPTRVEAVTVVNEEQRAALVAERVGLMADAPAINSMNTIITLNTHIGTHIDAPRHFYADGAAIDDIPLERLVMRDAVVLDVSHKRPGQGVTADDLEATGIRLRAGQAAVIKTLWTDRAFGKPEFWEKTIHLEPSVGEWIEARDVCAVAMDCFPEKPFWSMTLTPAERGANHKRWLKAGIPMIQMLTGLGGIAPSFTLIALPLSLKRVDGAPARVIGIEN